MVNFGTVGLRQGPAISSISAEARISGIALYAGMFPCRPAIPDRAWQQLSS
jgi:hypothetical protein